MYICQNFQREFFMKKIFILYSFTLFMIGSIFKLSAQNFARPNDWKKIRKEVFIQMGASGFLGDLGGLDKVGTHYSPVDYEFSDYQNSNGYWI